MRIKVMILTTGIIALFLAMCASTAYMAEGIDVMEFFQQMVVKP